jgi:hypothetical protein
MYYCWLKGFIEAGKARLKGDSIWDARQRAVKKLRAENGWLKELVSEPGLQIQLLKKSLNLYGGDSTGGWMDR